MEFWHCLGHFFHPMMDDPMWLIITRWLGVLVVWLVLGSVVLWFEWALDRGASILRSAEARRHSRKHHTAVGVLMATLPS